MSTLRDLESKWWRLQLLLYQHLCLKMPARCDLTFRNTNALPLSLHIFIQLPPSCLTPQLFFHFSVPVFFSVLWISVHSTRFISMVTTSRKPSLSWFMWLAMYILICSHKMAYYLALKYKIFVCSTICNSLENITINDISKTEKILCNQIYMWNP